MPSKRINYVIFASFLAITALICLQVKWMKDSHNLMEEQFDQKVRMALCLAVETLRTENDTGEPTGEPVCAPVSSTFDGFQIRANEQHDLAAIDSVLGMALRFYDIPLEYDLAFEQSCKPASKSGYCCTLSPMKAGDSDLMLVTFPGKDLYLMGKMKLMLVVSVIILLFITLVFIFASHTMWQQKRIHQINKDFFNNMAHEFRTPLTNIGLANNLLKRKNPELKENQFVQVINKESVKLKSQVERVLHLAKLENGEYQLEKEPLCVKKLLDEVVQGMTLQVKEKGGTIHLNIENEISAVVGDKFHLGNVFRNLIDNSLKYAQGPVNININLSAHPKGISILFEDSGPGIPKKEQAFVFDKYHRATSGDRHDQKGFGLGLSYVKMIMERHRGFIKIISDFNRGCQFNLFLPFS